MMSRRLFLSGVAEASFGLAASSALAQSYPQRSVKIITAGLPGTPFDLVARAIADKLSTSLKQTFIVETRPGAAGNVGAEFVAKAPADGHTLLMALDTTFTVNPSLYKKLPFDPLADFRFIAIAASGSNLHFNSNLGSLMLRSFLGASDADIPSNLLRKVTPTTVEALIHERRMELILWIGENRAYATAFDEAKAAYEARLSRLRN